MGEQRTLVLVPKKGRGLLTALSQFNLGDARETFAGYRDLIVRRNNWRVRLGDSIGPLVAGTGAVWGVHFFNSLDIVNSATRPDTTILFVAGPSGGAVNLYYWKIGGANGTVMAVNSPYELCFLTVKNRCLIAGMNNAPTIYTTYPSITNYAWGKAGPVTDLAYTPYTDVTNAATRVFYKAADIGNAGGGANIWTSATNAFDNSGAWNGKTLVVDHATTYTINTVSATNSLTTTTGNAGAAIVLKDFKVFYGNLNWTTQPPQYAMAYYAPSTGHITNIGPTLTLTEQDMSTVNVELLGIVGTNDPIYTRIVIFRTASDGGDLIALTLNPSHGGTATVNSSDFMIENTFTGTKTYRDGQPDTKLTLLGGAVGPRLNNPPPSTMRLTSYWDGRVWFTDSTRPWEVGFSGGPSQIPVGVAEECFPALNRVPIPSADGVITCLAVIGSTLVVGTTKNLYYMTGSSDVYRLVRLSSRAVDVGHWAIAEHPGDGTSDTASAIYIGQDRTLWRHRSGSRFEDIGQAIQDKLDAVPLENVSRPFLVSVGQLEKSWICALGFINAAKTKYSFYFYDFDAEQWYDWGFDESLQPGWSISYQTTYPAGIGLLVWGANASANYTAFGETNITGPSTAAKIKTQHLDMNDRLTKKTLQEVVLYVDDSSVGFSVKAAFDGSDASSGAALTLVPTINTPRYPGAGVMHFVPKSGSDLAGRQWHALQLEVSIPSDGSTVMHHLARLEIAYTLESTGVSGKP